MKEKPRGMRHERGLIGSKAGIARCSHGLCAVRNARWRGRAAAATGLVRPGPRLYSFSWKLLARGNDGVVDACNPPQQGLKHVELGHGRGEGAG